MFELEDFWILKKNGETRERYHQEKIINAINKSAAYTLHPLSDEDICKILGLIEKWMLSRDNNVVPISEMHQKVIAALEDVRADVANSYRYYRNNNEKMLQWMAESVEECQSIMFRGDKSNSNADSSLVSTKRVKQNDVFDRRMYIEFFLTPEERIALKEGFIYVHDMNARRETMNCCLFDAKNVLSGGFIMGNIWYNEPKSLAKAFKVIGDIVLMAASQQYGGFTLSNVDDLLEPYAQKTYDKKFDYEYKKILDKSYQDFRLMGIALNDEQISKLKKSATVSADYEANKEVEKQMRDGFQGWEYKFNTVASSRGDYPFITVTLGNKNSKWGKLASIVCLETRKNGQGKPGHKKPVLFPKLVFLYDKNLHGPGKPLEDVFETGIQCSSKTMYPDWLSLSGEGYISEMYKKYGEAISPMGCRAFLSPWYKRGGMKPADEKDTPVFVGRFNIGAISLHLPMILAKAKQENKKFYEVLDYYLNLIRNLHVRTYAYLGEMKASTNPLAYCEGGFLGGNLNLTDKIKPILKSATASFGITAFNELQMLYNGKSLVEDGDFAIEVLEYINKKINGFKEEDGNLYAVYGTPAENLCGLQIQQFRKKYGIIEGVSDKEYVSNSFHCHVTENITPTQKQDLEYRFWELSNGGKIQYVKYPIGYNIDAIRSLVRRAMNMGLYEGVNLSLSYCDDCGHEEQGMKDICPICGSTNLTLIDRMNGYLSYSRINGDTRLNNAKMIEISQRVSM